MNSLELYHYGIPGMKWGVRKDPYEKYRIRVARAQRRYNRVANKIRSKSSADRNIIYRNTIGDFRRGKAARLKQVLKHRKAKLAYETNKTSANRAALRKARVERIATNVGSAVLGVGGSSRGAYNRYRSNGKTQAQAAIATAGKVVVTAVATRAAVEVGKSMVNNYIRKSIGI